VEDRVKILNAGFQMHVSKPVEPDDMYDSITPVAIAFAVSIAG
jgi:CheY-like chemotaxis protein